MKSTFIFILFFIFLSISVSGQTPIPLTAMARSANPLMTVQTNSSRYQNYQYFTTAWGDTLLNFMQANPNWLGTYLPAGAVNIAAAGNNLQFTQGGTFRWTGDTTSLGEWIPQFTVSPALSGGLINQRLIGVGSLANKYIGTSGQDNVGLYVDGYPDLYLRNSQIQDTALAAGNYYTRVDEEGKVEFVPEDSIRNGIYSGSDTIPSQTLAYLPSGSGNGFAIGDFPGFPDYNNDFTENGIIYSPFYNGLIGIFSSDGTSNYTNALFQKTSFNLISRSNSVTPNIQSNFSFQAGQQTFDYRSTLTTQKNFRMYHLSTSDTSRYFQQVYINASQPYQQFGTMNGQGINQYGNPQLSNRWAVYQMDGVNTKFDFISVDESIGNNTLNSVGLYGRKYYLANSQPIVTNSVKSLHTWTGDGATTTPAMETMPFLFQYASFEVTGTNDTYTGQEPIHGWNQIGTSGVTGNITIQGDTMFQFPTAGVYEVEFNLILYSLATQSDFTLSINNVTDVTGFGTGSMEGQTQLNGGLEFTVKYILTASSGSAQFTQDLLGTGVGTIVRTGSRCNIKRLY